MTRTSANRWGVGAVAAACLLGAVPMAQGQGFFQPLFGAFSDNPALAPARPEPSRSEPSRALPFASERESHSAQPRARAYVSDESGGGGGSQAYCVRTCDGRYFPLSAGDGQSHAASCNSFCPASETKVVYGSSIDSAATEKGKSYSQLPNAFRYRTELVAGCTCNGKDQVGLAAIKIEDDPTLRKGDIVAGSNGLVIASRVSDKRGVDFSPASASLRAKYQRVPVVASE
jgi:hypothetical protein